MALINLKGIGNEAHELAGKPTHSTAKLTALSILGGTASGVATYQVNRGVAKAQGEAIPSLSPTTGGMEGGGAATSKALSNARKKLKRKGGK